MKTNTLSKPSTKEGVRDLFPDKLLVLLNDAPVIGNRSVHGLIQSTPLRAGSGRQDSLSGAANPIRADNVNEKTPMETYLDRFNSVLEEDGEFLMEPGVSLLLV